MQMPLMVRFLPDFKVMCRHPLAKPLVFVLALWPFVHLVWAAAFDQLGANPAEALVRATGDWSLRFLCVVLAVTPLRVLTGNPALARFRRMLGLLVYFYVVLHLLSYSGFDMAFDVTDIAKDIVKRPFILVGFLAFVVLSALALTSFNRAIRILGGKIGSVCTKRCTLWQVWPLCIFSGCGPVKITLPRLFFTPLCWVSCWHGGCGDF